MRMVPPSKARTQHPVIEFISVDGVYLKRAHLELSPGLNAFVGKRGAGKSTLIELMRFCLALPILPELAANHRSIVEANLGSGTVTVGFRSGLGARYVVKRSIGQPPRVTTADGVPVPVAVESLITARVLAQTEMIATAENRAALLRLLDTFLEAGGRPLFDEMEATERKLARNAADILRVRREMADDDDRAREVPALHAELEALASATESGADEARDRYRDRAQRARERAALGLAGREIADIETSLVATRIDLERRLATLVEAEDALASGALGPIFGRLVEELQTLIGRIGDQVHGAAEAVNASREVITLATQESEPAHARGESEFANFLRAHPEEVARAAQRARLEYRAAEAELAAQRVDARKREEHALLGRRDDLMRGLLALRRRLFGLRDGVRRRLNASLGGVLEINLVEAGDTGAYVALLTSALAKSRMTKEQIAEIAEYVRPERLAAAILEDNPRVLEEADSAKTGRAERARKVLDLLIASGRVFEIETVRVDDAVEVLVEHEGHYKPSTSVSYGQKSSSVLPILFMGAEGPLGIDQPEDALDKTYLYDVIVPGVLAAKGQQQLIFVTHEPNIPVLGRVDRLFLFESSGLHSEVRVLEGEEGQRTLERLCEGHERALRERAERYGYSVVA